MIGKAIAHYQIEALLGAGGMGEVYQARDTRLGRNVAVKMLPEIFARDADRVARFEREAKLLASLNHANIAALYGMEESGGQHFLVMELVEGQTLAERIARGPLPAEEALKIAHQITEAFEAAHEKGVIHRDLKPANVKITPEGKVKVLDFGLAKALESEPAQVNSNSPTMLSAAATNGGMILGTAGYMSPEQARGHAADQRSDIFSFGCVLYEMLTGRQTFPGDTVSDVLASVLAREPDLRALPHNLHPKIEELIRRCLAKNRKDRWHAIADVRVEIETIMADPRGLKFHAAHGVERRPLWKRALPLVVSAVLVAITALVVWNLRPAERPLAIVKFPFVLPEGQTWTYSRSQHIAISPDGATIVYAANRQLYLRTLADTEAKPIQGTALDADSPFFSPDGRWLAFYASVERKLKKIAITGGTPITICDATAIFGASWDSDDRIFIGQQTKGILRVSASGKSETVVAVKPNEVVYGPQLLPGGDTLLFTSSAGMNPLAWDRALIVAQSLKTGERKVLIEGGSDARFVPTGHIVYAVGSTLLAVPFDVKRLQTTGDSATVIEGVTRARVFPGGATAAAEFGTSNTGSMIYVPGETAAGLRTDVTLALVDRNGARKPLNIPPGPYNQPRISPNSKQLVLNTEYGEERVVQIVDVTGAAAPRKLTFDGHNHRATWSPDGELVVFTSDREGDNGLFSQRADGNGPAERLLKAEPGVTLQSENWSSHGNMIIYSSSRAAFRTLWMLSPGDKNPKPLITTYSTNSSLSPDGRWIAYTASESGGNEVYVQPFPPNGSKFQVSDGGRSPLWSPDGKQLFYLRAQGTGTAQIMSVDVQTQPSFVVVKTTPLPIEGIIGETGPRGYDITSDGKYFLVMIPKSRGDAGKPPAPDQINVTLNWFEELKLRAPARAR
jgi:eukaryotic-like serine/threonine-protein kinase